MVFFVIGVFILLEFNGFKHIRGLKEEAEVRVFLTPDADVQWIRKELKKEEGVRDIVFFSKDYALQEFRKKVKMSSSFLSEVDRNPLPSSFGVVLLPKYKTPGFLDSLSTRVEGLDGVKSFVYGREYIQNICKISTHFTWLCCGVCGLLFFLTLLTITTALNQRAVASRNEIALLKSLGVPKNRIRVRLSISYGVENLLLSGIAIGLVYCGHRFFLSKAVNWVVFLPNHYILGFIGGFTLLTFIISLIKRI